MNSVRSGTLNYSHAGEEGPDFRRSFIEMLQFPGSTLDPASPD